MTSPVPQLIVNGLMTGSIYVLVALSLGLLFGILGIPDFAQASMLMIGGFGTYFLVSDFGMPFFIAIPIVMLLTGVFGVIEERLTYKRLAGRDNSIFLVLSLALFILYQNVSILLFTGESRGFEVPSILNESLTIFGGSASNLRWLTIVIAVTVVGGIYVFTKYTKTGTAMRAVKQDREIAYLMGIDVSRITVLTFGIACALSAMAGGLLGAAFSVEPTMGQSEVLRGFVIIILGGTGNIVGAALGGFLLGLLESFSVFYISSKYTTAIVFTILIVVLIFKPEGLLGGSS